MITTRVKIWVGLLALAVGFYSLGGVQWARSAMRDESRHRMTVQFFGNWAVFGGDRHEKIRSDAAHITWHAGEHNHNQVHYGGKYFDTVTLGTGQYVVSLGITVDAATDTTCKIIAGKASYPGTSDRPGHCAVAITVTVP